MFFTNYRLLSIEKKHWNLPWWQTQATFTLPGGQGTIEEIKMAFFRGRTAPVFCKKNYIQRMGCVLQ